MKAKLGDMERVVGVMGELEGVLDRLQQAEETFKRTGSWPAGTEELCARAEELGEAAVQEADRL